jgi:pyruvate-ferredoxin/flavodoxin oxidoreductase
LTAEREKALSEQKTQLEAQLQTRESEAVAAAMRNLALRLTGMSAAAPAMAAPAPAVQVPAKAPPQAPAAAPAQVTPATAPKPEPTAAPVSEMPWIEEKLCTTCDECIAINKKLFAYNGNKKAYIVDPKAGPYRDIVRAAEKCSYGAIHPGLPLDPNEKDVDKLIKRAERFQ